MRLALSEPGGNLQRVGVVRWISRQIAIARCPIVHRAADAPAAPEDWPPNHLVGCLSNAELRNLPMPTTPSPLEPRPRRGRTNTRSE